ncbi:hypothetical protein FA13DRAFT_1744657, partial [Coprinellus micaceus]
MVNLPRKPGASESIPKVVLRVLEISNLPEGQLVQKHDSLTKTILGPWSTSRRLLEETYVERFSGPLPSAEIL